MANTNVKGITVEFAGDTTKLDKALRKVREEAKGLDKELSDINRALKFNPKNVELLKQKQEVLKQKVEQTTKSLQDLRDMQKQFADQGVDKNSEEYRRLQREIITTESKLKHFKGELSKVTAQASKVHQLGVAFDNAGKKIEGAGRSLQGVSRAAGAVTAVLGGVTFKASEMADDLNTLSKQTGISTQELQLYAAAADLTDVSVEAMAKSHTKLKKSMLTAQEGGSTLKYFEDLGVAVVDADGNLRDSNDVFNDTIKALGAMENETERDAIAMAIFGKSANELNPIIEDGGRTYEKVAKMMEEYGLEPVSQEELDKANSFKDQLDTIKLLFMQVVQIIGTKIAGYLVPIMEKVVAKAAEIAEWLGGLDGGVLTKIMAVAGAVALLSPALIILGKVISGVGMAIQSVTRLVDNISNAITFLAANPVVLIIAGIAALVAAIVILWNKSEAFRNFILGVWNNIKNAFGAVVDWFRVKRDQLISFFTGIPAFFSSVFGQAWSAIKAKFAAWGAFWGGLWNAIKNKFSKIGTSIANAISGAIRSGLNGAISRIESIINGGISLINGAINLINKIPGVSIGKIGRLNLPRLAKGGVLYGAQTVIAGEAGPEAIIPLDKLFAQMDKMTHTLVGAGGGITVNVYGAEGQSVRSLAEEVYKVIVQAEKRRTQAWA